MTSLAIDSAATSTYSTVQFTGLQGASQAAMK